MTEKWIVTDPDVCGGKPIIKGTRIPIDLILDKLAAGESIDQVLDAHPRLTPESVKAAIGFASESLKAETLYPTKKKASG